MKRFVIAAVLTCAILGAATSASAAVITWTLKDVTFVDGGAASGSFSYDTDAKTASNWDIVTTAGANLPGFHYQASNSAAFTEIFQTNTVLFQPTVGGYLYLHFVGPLTAAGGPVDLLTVSSPQGSIELGAPTGARAVRTGSLTTAVPEPGAWALMILGFGAAGSALRRRARNAVADVN